MSKSIYALQKENEANYKFLIWNRVQTLNCGVAHNCVARYRDTITALIQTSDHRDVVASKASMLLHKARLPTESRLPLLGGYKFDDMEAYLGQLYILENALGGAKAVREAAAIKKIDDARTYHIDGTAWTRQSAAYVRQKIDPSNTGFFAARCENVYPEIEPRLAPARQDFEVVIANSIAALELSEIVKPLAEQIRATPDAQLPFIKDAQSFCSKIYSDIKNRVPTSFP